ncbi:MAG: hypothetical protein IPL19_18680 [Sandaracinaceae bacterium]|nr:hypothetical protein [Sandaracinaceae bacterium]
MPSRVGGWLRLQLRRERVHPSDGGSLDGDTTVGDMTLDAMNGADIGPDPIPCTLSGRSVAVRLEEVDSIDVLFMVDNSVSMRDGKVALLEDPLIVEVLADGDRDGDGAQDFTPLASIHVGSSPATWASEACRSTQRPTATCCSARDDGVLLTVPRGSDPSLRAQLPPFLEFNGDTDNPALFAADVGCLARRGPTAVPSSSSSRPC